MSAYPNELDLDRAFWEALEASRIFREWLIRRTKFYPVHLELVTDEKWHQRWYRDPETGKDSETDILLIWRDTVTEDRFALHIENKPDHGKWEPLQAENYRRRAENRKAAWRYSDFEVVLLAPSAFVAGHLSEASHFDFVITYEEIGVFVPAFASAIDAALDETAPLDKLRVELLRRHLDPDSVSAQPWLAEVRNGRFDKIPAALSWSESAPFAHMINGYDLIGDVEILQRFADERLELAKRSGEWKGNPLELWACLFGEHRRAHFGGEPSGDELPLYDALCRTLRLKLNGGLAA